MTFVKSLFLYFGMQYFIVMIKIFGKAGGRQVFYLFVENSRYRKSMLFQDKQEEY